MESTVRHQTNLEQMGNDIVRAAEIADAPYDREIIQRFLTTYADFFSRSPVTFATNTQPKERRNLSVRYVDLQVPHDPFQLALEKGFLSMDDHPIYELMADIRSRFRISGYGAHLDAGRGLDKIGTFVVPTPVENALTIPSLPRSIKDYAHFFARHRLEMIDLLTMDFQHKQVNLYFTVKPRQLTDHDVADILNELDFEIPTWEICEYCSHATAIYFTFQWNSIRVSRVCFAIPAQTSGLVPAHLHPLLETYVNKAPFRSGLRRFIYTLTFEYQAHFIKIENDYTGSMIELMEQTHG
ncbi:MAG: aromatic prenyltransferase [Candidatus Omnitrophota bacterium]